MVKVEYISAGEAPQPPKPLTKSAAESLKILQGLRANQVARLTPDADKSARGLKSSLTRVARSNKFDIQTWTVDGDSRVYVRLTSKNRSHA